MPLLGNDESYRKNRAFSGFLADNGLALGVAPFGTTAKDCGAKLGKSFRALVDPSTEIDPMVDSANLMVETGKMLIPNLFAAVATSFRRRVNSMAE